MKPMLQEPLQDQVPEGSWLGFSHGVAGVHTSEWVSSRVLCLFHPNASGKHHPGELGSLHTYVIAGRLRKRFPLWIFRCVIMRSSRCDYGLAFLSMEWLLYAIADEYLLRHTDSTFLAGVNFQAFVEE